MWINCERMCNYRENLLFNSACMYLFLLQMSEFIYKAYLITDVYGSVVGSGYSVKNECLLMVSAAECEMALTSSPLEQGAELRLIKTL